jgi:hypothetical protein
MLFGGCPAGDLAGLRAWKLLRAVDAAHKLGMLINLWVFLYQGKYRQDHLVPGWARLSHQAH